MLWINYLDTGGERVHTSLEGSFRMEGWRGGGDEEECRREGCFQGKIHRHSSFFKPRTASFLFFTLTGSSMRGKQGSKLKLVVFTLVFSPLFI